MGGVPCGYFHAAPPPTRSRYCPDMKTRRSLYHTSHWKNDALNIFTILRGVKRRKIIWMVFPGGRAHSQDVAKKQAIARDNSF